MAASPIAAATGSGVIAGSAISSATPTAATRIRTRGGVAARSRDVRRRLGARLHVVSVGSDAPVLDRPRASAVALLDTPSTRRAPRARPNRRASPPMPRFGLVWSLRIAVRLRQAEWNRVIGAIAARQHGVISARSAGRDRAQRERRAIRAVSADRLFPASPRRLRRRPAADAAATASGPPRLSLRPAALCRTAPPAPSGPFVKPPRRGSTSSPGHGRPNAATRSAFTARSPSVPPTCDRSCDGHSLHDGRAHDHRPRRDDSHPGRSSTRSTRRRSRTCSIATTLLDRARARSQPPRRPRRVRRILGVSDPGEDRSRASPSAAWRRLCRDARLPAPHREPAG